MKKFFILSFIITLMINSAVFAAKIENDAQVAVMDFGTHPGAVTIDINIFNAGKTAHEYVLQRLFEIKTLSLMDKAEMEKKINSKGFGFEGLVSVLKDVVANKNLDIIDRFLVEEKIKSEKLNTIGLIDPDTALKLGKILGVKYIIYGNVNDVTLSDGGTQIGIGGVTVCTVKSHIILRMMNVETGEIISAAKGEGKSKSSFVKVGSDDIAVIEVGRTKVTQDSVHNAIQKAAFQSVDILIERLYGSK